jgi:MFS family permease
MYNIGFVVFIIGSALSGLAGTGLALVIYRVIQGVGAAMLTANSFVIISESFHENERARHLEQTQLFGVLVHYLE